MAALTPESALLAGAVLFLFALLSVGLASRPASAVPLLLLIEMGVAASINPALTIAHLHVYAGDIMSAALAAATVMRSQQRGARLRPTWQTVVVLLILLLDMARGAAAFGIQPPVVDARQTLAMLIIGVFFSTVRITPQLIQTVRNWFLAASTVLAVTALAFWFRHGFDTFATTGIRALNGTQALIILETTVIVLLFPPFRASILRAVLPLAGFVLVVLSIQRTVWVAGLVSAAVLVVARQKSHGSSSATGRRLLVATAALVVVLLVAAGPTGLTRGLTAGYQQTSLTHDSTLSWRIQGWSILIDRQLSGPVTDLLAGSPSGTGDARLMDGTIVTAPSHSEYVSLLLHTGIIGLVLLAWVYLAALLQARQRLRSPSPFVSQLAVLLTVLLALQLTFFVAYSEGVLAGLTLGLASALFHENEQDQSVEGPPHRTIPSPWAHNRAI
ncbi:MAG: hypothetical protein ACYDH5_20295 [Acidimicrobiales bacterium]